MTSEQVALRFGRGPSRVSVRELTGHDERSVADASTATAVELLARLVEIPGGGEWRADELAASDRDRLLAALYRRTFGGKIDSTATCSACGSPFDLSFTIDELMQAVEVGEPARRPVEEPDGTFRTADGLRFRLPTGRDEIEVALLPAEEAARELAGRCVVAAPDGVDALAAVEEAIEELAPVLDLEIATACPECGARQSVEFDVQFYLLRAIAQERAQFTREIHRIAAAYGWSLDAILGLRRSERKALAELIEMELPARRRG